MESDNRIAELLHKQFKKTLTSEERSELDAWLKEKDNKLFSSAGDLEREILKDSPVFESIEHNRNVQWEKARAFIYSEKVSFFNKPFFRIAASIIVLLGCVTIGWMFGYGPGATIKTKQPVARQDVAPGGDRAVLTLADGTQVVLDTAFNGVLTRQGNTQVVKQADGQLAYSVSGEGDQQIFYNTMRTPRGGQYRLVLPDGTKVWLNAASSITYPTQFTGTERRINMSGEAYFEVAKNAGKPFYVDVAASEVRVLGTHFNVNAYEDEQVFKTTLLEGGISVKNNIGSKTLEPGEEILISETDNYLKINRNADLKKAVAWKNGEFSFEKADIREIMRQLGRWYDVEVVYEDLVKGGFYANIKRNEPISKILELLSLTGKVYFTIEGKKITVTNHK